MCGEGWGDEEEDRGSLSSLQQVGRQVSHLRRG